MAKSAGLQLVARGIPTFAASQDAVHLLSLTVCLGSGIPVCRERGPKLQASRFDPPSAFQLDLLCLLLGSHQAWTVSKTKFTIRISCGNLAGGQDEANRCAWTRTLCDLYKLCAGGLTKLNDLSSSASWCSSSGFCAHSSLRSSLVQRPSTSKRAPRPRLLLSRAAGRLPRHARQTMANLAYSARPAHSPSSATSYSTSPRRSVSRSAPKTDTATPHCASGLNVGAARQSPRSRRARRRNATAPARVTISKNAAAARRRRSTATQSSRESARRRARARRASSPAGASRSNAWQTRRSARTSSLAPASSSFRTTRPSHARRCAGTRASRSLASSTATNACAARAGRTARSPRAVPSASATWPARATAASRVAPAIVSSSTSTPPSSAVITLPRPRTRSSTPRISQRTLKTLSPPMIENPMITS